MLSTEMINISRRKFLKFRNGNLVIAVRVRHKRGSIAGMGTVTTAVLISLQ